MSSTPSPGHFKHCSVLWPDLHALPGAAERNALRAMNMLDLLKATVICGIFAFVVYSVPVVSQVVIIALLSLLWSSYAYRTLSKLLRR